MRLMLLVVCAAAAVWVIWPQEPEPSYRGRKLSEWLSLHDSNPYDQQARQAIRQIGTNALPTLTKWIQYEQPGWRTTLIHRLDAGANSRFRRFLEGPAPARARLAIRGFRALGDVAWPAIPDLARIMYQTKSTQTWQNVKYALDNMQGDTVLLLAQGLMDKSPDTRAGTATYLRSFALFPKESFLDPAPAVPLLIRAMDDKDPNVVAAAATTLGKLALQAGVCVPALTNKLSSPTAEIRIAAARALVGFQGQAQAAVPSLLTALADPNLTVRVEATNALDAIAPEVLTAQVKQ